MRPTAKNTMHNAPKITLAVTTALVSVALAGCTTNAAPLAETSFAKAQSALASGKVDQAVSHAEAAVQAEPRNASYRAMLGASYLEAGRFQAAATSFADAMELGDADPRTVLSYALAETALGNHAAALSVLGEWEADLDPADLGLALALAGQPDRGVHILSNALRAGQNTAKVRQNLAYAYALQGNWRAARVMAAEDVPAGEIDDRIGEWAQTARPELFTQRVAGLLQVTPVLDSGQPAHLALANNPSHDMMVAEAASEIPGELPVVDNPQFAIAEAAPVQTAPISADPASRFDEEFAAVEPVAVPVSAPAAQRSRFVSQEVVQSLPTNYAAAKSAPAKAGPRIAAKTSQRRMASPVVTDGTHLVQLGSFSTRANAERAKSIYQNRHSALSGHDMVITKAEVRGKTYWRVAASGFDAAGARNVCGTVKAQGKSCVAYAENSPMPGAVRGSSRMAAR